MRRITLMLTVILFTAGCMNQPAATATAVPTETPAPLPTETIAPTETALPTETPAPSPTAGPLLVQDDFSTQSDIWGECEHCTWQDGSLLFGPYEAKSTGSDQIFYLLCEACGTRSYYRVAADVTFADGYGADRSFGILAGLGESYIAGGTVTTNKHALYEVFDYKTRQWGGTQFEKFDPVLPGTGTNRIEVILKPAAAGRADIYVNINGTNVIMLFDQRVEPTQAGLYLGWYAVGVAYDNFEYEELVP